jgi:hypothetical protein
MGDRWLAALFVGFALLTVPSSFTSASSTAGLVGGVVGSLLASFFLAFVVLAVWRKLRGVGSDTADDQPDAEGDTA